MKHFISKPVWRKLLNIVSEVIMVKVTYSNLTENHFTQAVLHPKWDMHVVMYSIYIGSHSKWRLSVFLQTVHFDSGSKCLLKKQAL